MTSFNCTTEKNTKKDKKSPDMYSISKNKTLKINDHLILCTAITT